MDSVSILYLITELESAYEIQIPLEDIVEENFRNLECIEKYVVSLIGEKE